MNIPPEIMPGKDRGIFQLCISQMGYKQRYRPLMIFGRMMEFITISAIVILSCNILGMFTIYDPESWNVGLPK